ncbi:MAG: 1,2-phenylacetyl-CoA epoxidase subunit PaaC [Sandaracinaceae bacterium]
MAPSPTDPGTTAERLALAVRLGDAALVLAQRLAAWTGHGPTLEQDIALTNLSLDLFGQARGHLTYAGQLEGRGRTEDDLAFGRDVLDFRNPLLVEQPNGDFAHTMVRQLLFDAYHLPLLEGLARSRDARLSALAQKAQKEVRYHLEHSRGWVIRLGDGTDESHRRTQTALDDLVRFTPDLVAADDAAVRLAAASLAPDPEMVRERWQATVAETLARAGLLWPETGAAAGSRGRAGQHTEHLGYLLAEMQFLHRAYPGARW